MTDFDTWMKQVDVEIDNITVELFGERLGIGAMDLPDVRYRDFFDDGDTPRQAAGEALENAGINEDTVAMNGGALDEILNG